MMCGGVFACVFLQSVKESWWRGARRAMEGRKKEEEGGSEERR